MDVTCAIDTGFPALQTLAARGAGWLWAALAVAAADAIVGMARSLSVLGPRVGNP